MNIGTIVGLFEGGYMSNSLNSLKGVINIEDHLGDYYRGYYGGY